MSAPQKRSWGGVIFFLLIVAAAGGGFWYWKKRSSTKKPVEFKTADAARGDIVQIVTASGQLNPVRNIQVGTQVSGIIQEIMVDFNSAVTNGQVIAKIDPSTYNQQITQDQADLENAQAALEYAQLNFKRAKPLRDGGLLSDSDYDKSVADLHQAQAVVKMREASLNKSKVDLERTTIFSPVDGIVISRNVDVGQTVASSFNTPTLFQIANDLRKMRIETMVSEADVGGVEVGQKVNFSVDAFVNRQFSGIVSQVRFNPITNQNVVNYTAIVDVDNGDLKLRPGMTATASIITGERKNTLRIPNSALRYRPSDELLPGKGTNMVHQGKNGLDRDSTSIAADTSRPASGGGGSGLSPEERRKRWESMTPEQKAQIMQRRGQGGGGRSREGGQEGPVSKTIYVLDGTAAPGAQQKLKPVVIKAGISDANYTEVIDGLKEGDKIVTGVVLSADATPAQPGGSPFGSPFGNRNRSRAR